MKSGEGRGTAHGGQRAASPLDTDHPGEFANGVLGAFATGIWAQIHPDLSGMFTIVVDVLSPMSTHGELTVLIMRMFI